MTSVPTLLFGPAGVPQLAASRDSEAGIARVKRAGLDCMEIEFVRGVSMGDKKAARVRAVATEAGIALTVHAPYYINFNSRDPAIVEASKKRLFEAARVGSLCGAKSVAFHPGFYMGDSPSKTFGKVKRELWRVVEKCREAGIDIQLRPETTGKPSQFGRLDEILALSVELDGVLPCVDFAHLHAYDGQNNSYDEFAAILGRVKAELGQDALADMHIHTSGIRFGQKGELQHLNLDKSDLNYTALLRALKTFSVKGRIVCESPDREADALLMKNVYRRIRKKRT